MKQNEQHPDLLFDTLKKENGIELDATFCRTIGLHPPSLNSMRAKRIAVGPTVILKIQRALNVPLARIDRLLAGIKD